MSFKRLVEWARALPPGVVRIKGIISVTERPGHTLAFHGVGKRVGIETISEVPAPPNTELVIIGEREAIDPDALEAGLDRCFEPASSARGS